MIATEDLSDHDLLIRIDENVEGIRGRIDDQEIRIRCLERWKDEHVGESKAAGVTGGIAGAGGGFIGGFAAVWVYLSKFFGGT